MESEANLETTVKADDVQEGAEDQEKGPESTGGELGQEGEGGEASERVEGEHVEREGLEGEHVEGEHVEGEGLEGEHVEGEFVEGEGMEGEHAEGEPPGEGEEKAEGEEKVEGEEKAEGEELIGEGLEGEQLEGEGTEKIGEEVVPEEAVEEEEKYVEEPPPDPAAPYDFSDSKEALKAPFELRPDQLAEVEQVWELYQNCTPAYADIDGYVTEKEVIYMLKSLLLMTYTIEQLQELIAYCCRPPHAKGFIYYEQFLKMVTIRQRDFPIEEEIRAALQVYDPEKTGILDRDNLREVLTKQGNKMSARLVDNLIKEVDISNDGTIGLEDVVATMCIDLNKEDLQILRAAVCPRREDMGDEADAGAQIAMNLDEEDD